MCKLPDNCKPYRNSAKAEAWFKRSTAMRVVSVVEADVAALTANCSLFQRQLVNNSGSSTDEETTASITSSSHEGNNNEREENIALFDRKIGLFHRKEIEEGRLVGEGAFSNVHEVRSIKLTSQCHFTKTEQEVREYHRHRINNVDRNEHGKYVVKHLKSDLINHRQRFNQAAADLVIE